MNDKNTALVLHGSSFLSPKPSKPNTLALTAPVKSTSLTVQNTSLAKVEKKPTDSNHKSKLKCDDYTSSTKQKPSHQPYYDSISGEAKDAALVILLFVGMLFFILFVIAFAAMASN